MILLDGAECYGRINFAECEIKIRDRDINQQYQAITLWHEILHGIVSGSTVEIENEEEVVEMFARGIYQVLQDNGKRFFDLKEAE